MSGTAKKGRLMAATLLESVLALGLMAMALSFAVGLHARLHSADRGKDLLYAWALTEQEMARQEALGPVKHDNRRTELEEGFVLAVQADRIGPRLQRVTYSVVRYDRTVLQRRFVTPWVP
jgi:hypothetical protein